jgi:hypothetical protein
MATRDRLLRTIGRGDAHCGERTRADGTWLKFDGLGGQRENGDLAMSRRTILSLLASVVCIGVTFIAVAFAVMVYALA